MHCLARDSVYRGVEQPGSSSTIKKALRFLKAFFVCLIIMEKRLGCEIVELFLTCTISHLYLCCFGRE